MLLDKTYHHHDLSGRLSGPSLTRGMDKAILTDGCPVFSTSIQPGYCTI